ncbi:acyltransferase family protein [Actinoallomurus soli]|uniref:acyltransferase family protein n=1 Tax=Actinoallomurus soli TaxID=2952535 RepID=UPI0020938827|nr:acyltransferase [Actinoallomurus soli]MCO5972655.1 acyltransferase [Actinoallomurus soli]
MADSEPSRTGSPASSAARLAWLDLLRGIAAMVVALHHATYYYVPRWRAGLGIDWFDPGLYGVLVFFLVSGYIIPASLERHGQVRRFWISRVLRIYPLLTTACAITLLPYLLGVRGLRAGLEAYRPATAVLAHLTMLQDVLAVPNVINVLWTLSYEMLFYLLVVALFVTRTHRLSAPIAVTLAAAAVLVGGLLPMAALSRTVGIGPTAALTAVVMVTAIVAAVSTRPSVRTAGGILGGVLAIALVGLNGRIGPWQSLIILAVMFTGTALYRAEHGQIRPRTAVLSAVVVLVCAVAAGALHAQVTMAPAQVDAFAVYWSGSLILAALTFAGGWALRRHRIPRWLTGLGAISFSLYLLHPVLLMLSDQFGGTPDHDDALRLTVFVAVLIAVSALTYRYVESPFQRLGRRIGRSTATAARRPAVGDAAGPVAAPAPDDVAS